MSDRTEVSSQRSGIVLPETRMLTHVDITVFVYTTANTIFILSGSRLTNEQFLAPIDLMLQKPNRRKLMSQRENELTAKCCPLRTTE